jgi:hypothetical protein
LPARDTLSLYLSHTRTRALLINTTNYVSLLTRGSDPRARLHFVKLFPEGTCKADDKVCRDCLPEDTTDTGTTCDDSNEKRCLLAGEVGLYKLNAVGPYLEGAWFRPLEPIMKLKTFKIQFRNLFFFKYNLCRYSEVLLWGYDGKTPGPLIRVPTDLKWRQELADTEILKVVAPVVIVRQAGVCVFFACDAHALSRLLRQCSS